MAQTESQKRAFKKYYEKNREKRYKLAKEWKLKNPEKTREINKLRGRRYRLTENGKIATKKAIDKYEKNHPERRKAWTIARTIDKTKCIKCNEENTHRHHPDISKPNEVILLCPKHHKEAHRHI
jgi:hypothetical protein